MPTCDRYWSAGSRIERQKRGLQRVLTMFGQFLRGQRDTQHIYNLHHAHVLT